MVTTMVSSGVVAVSCAVGDNICAVTGEMNNDRIIRPIATRVSCIVGLILVVL